MPTNTPRMMIQSIQSILQFLHSLLTIQLTSLKQFHLLFIILLMRNSKVLPQLTGTQWYKNDRQGPKGPRRRATGPEDPK